MSKYLGASVIAVESNKHGEKVVHFFADSYCSEDSTNAPYRFTEYCWGYISLRELVENGMPDGEWYGELEQYIDDCTEKQLDEIYERYNNGKMPQIIDNLAMDTPLGLPGRCRGGL